MEHTVAASAAGRHTADRSERDARFRRQTKELGDPTRHAIYRAVADAARCFEPRRAKTRSSIDLILGRCPFQAVAGAVPEVICELHRGLAEGVIEASGGTLEITDLIARDSRKAGCRLKFRRTMLEPLH